MKGRKIRTPALKEVVEVAVRPPMNITSDTG